MGCRQTLQPLVREESNGPALCSAHSLLECCQHAVCPDAPVRPLRGWGLSGGDNHKGYCRRSLIRAFGHSTFTSLRPFAPPALTGFIATMDALTPAWSALRPHSRAMNTALCQAGLPVLRVWPSEHSAPNHPARPQRRFRTQPLSAMGFRFASVWASPFTSKLAARPGRNGFVNLRTARSPPVAPHLASRRRSYVQLQAGECVPEEDFHLSDLAHLQTH
jgi:hypothetical protein